MCLILFAWRTHPEYPLVLAANRDEFYARPTAPMDFWGEAPHLLAGRDLREGGTWFGVTRDGRMAAVTNYRDPSQVRSGAPSRGRLVSDYLLGEHGAEDYLRHLQEQASAYNGFNLLLGEGGALHYYSNHGTEPRRLAPGVYGLSNHLLDTPWPKVRRGKEALAAWLDAAIPDPEALLALLADDTLAADAELPRTGVSLEWERRLSPIFIRSADYGTRSSTVLLRDRRGRVRVWERNYPTGETRFFAW
ncbi:MAG TPA: NRDE family protein [Candidatus Competibacteraceae bacterium]|nr:NRDE family protein [Candidatus Competibacteraceae bacterium]